MSRPRRGIRRSRIGVLPWLGAIAVHAGIVLLLQFSGGPAQSTVQPRPEVEAVRVQAADESLLQKRREAHHRALRELELQKQREREAQRKEAERKLEEKRQRKEEARKKAEEKKNKAVARAEAKRKAKEAERKLAQKRQREKEARRRAEEEKQRAVTRAAVERKAREEARKLKEAEGRAQARQEKQARRQQREAARRARQVEAWRIAITKKIESRWQQPPAVRSEPCEVVVEQDKTGKVLSAAVRDGCRASKTWQDSLRNAVLKASPLPSPSPADLFDRKLVITFHPKASH